MWYNPTIRIFKHWYCHASIFRSLQNVVTRYLQRHYLKSSSFYSLYGFGTSVVWINLKKIFDGVSIPVISTTRRLLTPSVFVSSPHCRAFSVYFRIFIHIRWRLLQPSSNVASCMTRTVVCRRQQGDRQAGANELNSDCAVLPYWYCWSRQRLKRRAFRSSAPASVSGVPACFCLTSVCRIHRA